MFSLPLFALFLAAFAVGTTEFVITGILPDVAGDLSVSIPTAGYLISGYAAGVAIGGPIMAIVTAGFERKATLLGLMALFVVGNALCALAPSYGWLMAARVIVSLSHGAFFGIAIVAASSLVPENRRSSAIAIVIAGITVANIIGVPIGTAIGHNYGWRWTFAAIAALGVVSAVGTSLWLPKGERGPAAGSTIGSEIRALGRQEVYLSYAMIVAAATGFFGLFAYIAPLLIEVSGASPAALPWVLSVFGVGALVGNLAGGRLADWKLMPSIIGIFAALAAVYVILLFAAHALVPATIALFAWSVVNFAFAAPLQSRIVLYAREAPNLAATLISTAFNIGIAGGAALGSVALTHGFGYAELPWLGLAGVLPALALAVVSLLLERREAVR